MQPSGTKNKVRRGMRWVVCVLAALMFAVLAWTWLINDAQRQDKLMRTAGVLLGAYALFLIWMIFVSRWRTRARWTVFVMTMVAIVGGRLALRISGVTGDLVPIVEWRWKKRQTLAVASGAGTNTGPAVSRSGAENLTNSYPQFLGPNRNGVVHGTELGRDWAQSPPRELWRRNVGSGWSGFAVAGARAVTQEQRGAEEAVVCYDLLTGAPRWARTDESRYATTIAGEGPRATPTIWSNRVYTLGGAGLLNCLDLASGELLWQTNVLAAHGARVPEWGMACSPLVTEYGVFVTAGGRNSSMVAYDKETGRVLWTSGNDDVHWSSPIRVSFNDVPQIVIFSENVSSYDEATGRLLWHYPWRNSYPHVTVPLLLSSNRVLVSQGYGTGAELLQVSATAGRWEATRVWKSIRMKSKFGTLIEREGFVYGLDDGALACIDASTGELKWKGDRYGHGQMLLVADLLLMTAESGDIVLLEPNPTEQRELARHKVFHTKTWNPLAVARDLLLVRTDREAACLRLPVRAE